MTDYNPFDYIKVIQPIGEFYIASIPWDFLIKISQADVRKINDESKKDDGFDSYLGIQRELSPKRVGEIAKYVQTSDATFPTGIILHIESKDSFIGDDNIKVLDDDFVETNINRVKDIENIKIDSAEKKLLILNKDNIAKILDGQHRIEGLKEGLENNPNAIFDLNVTIFVDLDIDDQAQIFSVINKAQTKVNKSLVYDLYDYGRTRSPQKTAHDIVRILNKRADSPFFKKIKILGTANNKEVETIAQATLVELIIKYISTDPVSDRDILRRKTLFGYKDLKKETNPAELKKRIFRNLFVENKDEIIMLNLWNYFKSIQNKWSKSWNDTQTEGNIINKTTGIIAFMKLLPEFFNNIPKEDGVMELDLIEEKLKSISLTDDDFNKLEYVPGSSGQSKLYRDLKSEVTFSEELPF